MSTLDDSDDEPGVENIHLVRKQFLKMKLRKQVCQLARKPARQKEANLSMLLPRKTLESWKEGRREGLRIRRGLKLQVIARQGPNHLSQIPSFTM